MTWTKILLVQIPPGPLAGPSRIHPHRVLQPDPLLLHLRPGQHRARVPVQPHVVHKPIRVQHPQEREESGYPHPPGEARHTLYLRVVPGEERYIQRAWK